MQNGAQRLTVVAHPPLVPPTFEISEGELETLRDDVLQCRRSHALEWLDQRRKRVLSANPGHPNTAVMLGYLVQWAEGGGNLAEELAELESRVSVEDHSHLPLAAYLFLRFTRGVLDYIRGRPDGGDLDFVITVASNCCVGSDLLLFAHQWKARMERKKRVLEIALTHAKLAQQTALQRGCPAFCGKAIALEALIVLDSGLPNAEELLRQAETALRDSDDWLWLGRIQDGFGQTALEEGRYQSALHHFATAKDFFSRSREPHRELAWAYFRAARAQRLMASRLAKQIDAAAESRRRSLRTDSAPAVAPNAESRPRLEMLRREALSALALSEAIFRSLQYQRAVDAVSLECAALWAELGDLQQASQQAGEAFRAAQQRYDTLLMAEARLLQSRIEKTYCEEGVGLDPVSHAQQASEYIKEASALAAQCHAKPSVKRRLIAAVYVTEGLLLLNEFFNNPEAARECCQIASDYVNASLRDELWEEYTLLASRALHSGGIDAKLRKWSEGLAEGKTFQQITEEFAEVVIPAIWAREGKNTSRVVTKLSISPKKVRRILNRVGLKA